MTYVAGPFCSLVCLPAQQGVPGDAVPWPGARGCPPALLSSPRGPPQAGREYQMKKEKTIGPLQPRLMQRVSEITEESICRICKTWANLICDPLCFNDILWYD